MKYFLSILAICLIFLFVNRLFTNPIVLPIPWSDPQLLCDSVGNNLNPSFARDTYFIEGYNALVWQREWGNSTRIFLKDFAHPDSEFAVTPDIPTSISDDDNMVPIVGFQLYQNYPNPFNPVTVIGYQLFVSGDVELTIYNLLGQPVKNLVKGKQPAGYYEVPWNGKDDPEKKVASGVYIYSLKVDKKQSVRRCYCYNKN